MPYRYRTTTALFPLVSPPPRPAYPHWAVTRRFAICAIPVAVFPVLICGIVLAQLRCYRNLRGLLLAALAGALSWCGIMICSNHARFGLFELHAALVSAAVFAVIALIALPNSPPLHGKFTAASSTRPPSARY